MMWTYRLWLMFWWMPKEMAPTSFQPLFTPLTAVKVVFMKATAFGVGRRRKEGKEKRGEAVRH